jgi:DNA helicase-2/ATP-dependent DNA helicase PcrA
MRLGDTVHKALAVFFGAYLRGKTTKALLLRSFKESLDKTALSGFVYTEIHDKGISALDGWFDAYKGAWHKETKNEYRVDTVLEVPLKELHELRVRGDLDKVEIHPDGVVVVDYKTGKPKSRNHCLGKTKAPDSGNYFRQLAFYKMLLDREGVYTMKEGVIDFIEPKDTGRYIQERFLITPADVGVLTQEITQMAREVMSLSFWDTRCDDKKCEYCALRDMME